MRKITKTSAKKKAWKYFSLYIRQKYADKNGFVNCYTCDNVKNWKEMQAGHGIGGRHGGVLFLEELVRPQCAGCNIFGAGKYSIFTEKLIDEMGVEKYYEIIKKSNRLIKYTIDDYLMIADMYKEREEVKEE